MNQHPYDLLTPDTVIDAVESTGRLSDARLLALNSYENRVYQVGIEDGDPLITKFYRPGRWSRQQIDEEHSFSLELEAAEISVIAPMASERRRDLNTVSTSAYNVCWPKTVSSCCRISSPSPCTPPMNP